MLDGEIVLRFLNGGPAAPGFLGSGEPQNVTTGGDDAGVEGGVPGVEVGETPVYATAFFYLAGLFVGVLGLAAMTWLVAYVADHCCGCFPWCRSIGYYDGGAMAWDKSDLARRARLFGLTLPERRRILQDHVFEEITLYAPDDDTDETTSNDIEAGRITVERRIDEDEEEGPTNTESKEQQQQQPQPPPQQDPLDDADHERYCCICLAQYQDQDRLLRGKLCGHQFHYQCSMDWLMKPRDNCPYCREWLVSVEDFRRCAVQCLGIKRVDELGGGGVTVGGGGNDAVEMTSRTTASHRNETGSPSNEGSASVTNNNNNTITISTTTET